MYEDMSNFPNKLPVKVPKYLENVYQARKSPVDVDRMIHPLGDGIKY